MRIRRLVWTTFRLPFVTPFATARATSLVREGLIVQVFADDLIGLGEASPTPSLGGQIPDTLTALETAAPRLVGHDLDGADALLAEIDTANSGVAAARCAIDSALCDLRAQANGIPIAQLLGSSHAQSVQVNAVVGTRDVSDAARGAIAAGFDCVKLKVGMCASAGAEIARIEAAREAIGPGVCLRLDANGLWEEDEAVAIIRAAERFELELVEQPVADLEAMARVRSAVATPIAADESASSIGQVGRIAALGAADLVVVKPMVVGGLRLAQRMIHEALSAGLGAFVTSTIDAGVGVAGALHVAATLPASGPACGLATGQLLVDDLIAQPLAIERGWMSLPGGPGIGVALDDAALARYGGGWHGMGQY